MVLAILLLISALWLVFGTLMAVGASKLDAKTRVNVVIGDTFLVVVMVLAAIALM